MGIRNLNVIPKNVRYRQASPPAGTWDGIDISLSSYDSVSFDISGQDGNMYGIFFKPDGTKMFGAGLSNDSVFSYTLSTPWDLSTASYDSVSFSVAAQDGFPADLFFKDDGTEMYVIGYDNDSVYQYTLSTPWDISSASHTSTKDVSAQENSPSGVEFNNDGSKMYVGGYGTENVYQYSLGTNWDITTATHEVTFDPSSVVTGYSTFEAFAFAPDGSKVFILDGTGDNMHQFSLYTFWDISTASYDGKAFDVGGVDSNPRNVDFSEDGTKFYVSGATNDEIYQFSTNL